MTDVLAMGGYGLFVWAAYGVTLGVLALAVFFSLHAHARARRRLHELEAASAAGKAGAP